MIPATLAIFALALAATPFGAAPPARRARRRHAWKSRVRKGAPMAPRRARRRGATDLDLGTLTAETATRLRAGARPDEAWNRTLVRAGLAAEPEPLDPYGVPPALRSLAARRGLRRSAYANPALSGAIAACRLSHSAGAPMADILEACAEGITESAEAASARDVALAGPQTSAQMIAWMPIIGIVMGSALGAEPLGFLVGTWVGRAVLALAVGLEIAGILWVRKLARNATTAAE